LQSRIDRLAVRVNFGAVTPKRILILGPAWPLRGGIAATDELLCKAFLDGGHSCEIISFSLQYPGFLFPGSSQFDTNRPVPAMKIRALVNSVNPFNWLAVGGTIKREKPDLIIVRYWLPFMGPSLGTIVRRARKNRHTKVIALVDNAIPHESRVGDKMFTRYFTRSCDAFLAMSQAVIKDLQSLGVTKPTVFSEHPLYTSFGEATDKSAARKKLQLDEHGKYLLFFGLIRRYKGLDLLLEAMGDARVKERNVKLIVAGEYYEDESYYTEIIRRNALQDHVVLHTKYIADEDVKHYFSACDLVTQTYHSATQSGVTKVAMQFGKPSLVTDVGGLGEIIAHGRSGYVVPADKKVIADSIVDFYDHHREPAFVNATREDKKKYSWEVMVKAFESLHDNIRTN
jgi:glycosyltransferase involved in cell wall biosynthesis